MVEFKIYLPVHFWQQQSSLHICMVLCSQENAKYITPTPQVAFEHGVKSTHAHVVVDTSIPIELQLGTISPAVKCNV